MTAKFVFSHQSNNSAMNSELATSSEDNPLPRTVPAPATGSTFDVPLGFVGTPPCVVLPVGAVKLADGSRLVRSLSVTPKAPTSALQKLSLPGN